MVTLPLANGALAGSQPVLKRTDLAYSPLGRVGNLRFREKQVDMALASRVSVFTLRARHSLAKLYANLKFGLGCVFPSVRAQRKDLLQARENSRLVGDLLGKLTIPADAILGQKEAVYLALVDLGRRSRGDLANLRGGMEALTFYMKELDDLDLFALRKGILGDPYSVECARLDIERRWPNNYAGPVLDQIVVAFEQHFAQTMHERLERIAVLVSASPINGRELKKALLKLDNAQVRDRLSHHLSSLPKDQLVKLQVLMQAKKLKECTTALARAKADGVLDMLDVLRRSLVDSQKKQ